MMDGSGGESMDLSSPQHLGSSPNPDSSAVRTSDATPPNGPPLTLSIPPSLSPKSGQSLANMAKLGSPGSSAGSSVPARSASASPPNLPPVSLSKSYNPTGIPPVSVASKHGTDVPQTLALNGNAGRLPAGCPPPPTSVGIPVGAYGAPRMERPVHPVSPPGIPADASVNECRLIDYRGAKVAAFLVSGEFLLCLPQAFELFLKHLVGGLHTVYTKLKRLDITPIVCNVEQVRILRGLGAIQPGVNRCKLLSCKDFDILYKDCTTARQWRNVYALAGDQDHYENNCRPGRPPKRASMVGLSPGNTTPNSLLKKSRMDSDYSGYTNGHITGDRLDKSSMLPNGYNHHAAAQAAAAAAAAASAPPHLNPLPFMALNHPGAHHNAMIPGGVSLPLTSTSHAHSHSLVPRSEGSVIKDRSSHGSDMLSSSRLRDERSENQDGKDNRMYSFDPHRLKDPNFLNGASANGHSPVLNLSQNSSRGGGGGTAGGGGGSGGGASSGGGDQSGSEAAYNDNVDDEDNDTEDDEEDDRDQDLSDNPDVSSTANSDRLTSSQTAPFQSAGGDSGAATNPAVSSIETLLRNIQGLLKVAADNARQQERQINLEKAELKMEILRERELRENLEKQLLEEQRTRILYQKRLKKEKKCRRRLHEQLESEMKKRTQYEEALRNTSAETLRLLNESLSQELEMDRNSRSDAERKIQDCPMSV